MADLEVNVSFQADASLDHIEVLVRAPERGAQAEALIARLCEPERYLDLPSEGGRIFRVRTDGIIRVYSQNRSNYVCVGDEIIRTSMSMNELESRLGRGRFLRVSRFDIINLDKAENFDFTIAGVLRIRLEGDQTVYASRRYIPAIRDYLKGGDAK